MHFRIGRYSGGILVAFDAREARASISIDDSDVSAGQGVSIEGKSEINTDLSKTGICVSGFAIAA